MPGIRDALEAEPRTGGVRSLVDKALEKMDPDLRKLALELLDSDKSDQVVADAFTDEGYKIKSTTPIRNYRSNHKVGRFAVSAD